MKQKNWTTSCTQNESERARETLIWPKSVTQKETGNVHPDACVDVLPRCCPNLSLRQSWEHCHIDLILRIHVTRMLKGIYVSLRSAGNLFSGLRPRNFLFKIFQFLPSPFNKKMEWAVLYPKYILFPLSLNSKLAKGWGRGLGGVNRVRLRTLSYFPLPTELSNSWVR